MAWQADYEARHGQSKEAGSRDSFISPLPTRTHISHRVCHAHLRSRSTLSWPVDARSHSSCRSPVRNPCIKIIEEDKEGDGQSLNQKSRVPSLKMNYSSIDRPFFFFFFFFSVLSSSARLMCGKTPPKAMVALIRVSSSSSPRIASCRWRGVMRLTLRSLVAF